MVISNYWLAKSRYLADEFDEDIIFHAIVRDPEFIGLLEELNKQFFPFVKRDFFKGPFIVNSFSILKNIQESFSREIHRDQKFFSGKIPLMLNVIIALDEFTWENGATEVLYDPMEQKPSKRLFDNWAKRLEAKPGDINYFNANLWHRAGINRTGKPRRAIAITLTKSCMKQLLDYPKALGDIDQPEEIKQLLGYHSRVPVSLDEWNGPRTYLKDQD